MQFGQRKADAPAAGGDYLRGFKKGETKVRFLDEPDEWIAFREHFTRDRKGFPCTEDKLSCPGCTHGDEEVRKASRKYAAQVLLVKQNVVLPFKIPVSLSDRLAVRAERNGGTLLNRDYVVLRSGDGFDTEYDVDQEDKYPVDLAELKKKITLEIQDCFQESFKEVWGSVEDPKLVTPKGPSEANNAEDKPPSEPTGATSDPASENELTEAAVRAMEKPDLRKLCDRAEIKWTEDDTKAELLEKIFAKVPSGA